MKALCVLEDGFVLSGRSFTGSFNSGGSVIFHTAMLGYQEILTDPAYAGQMVCMTWPLIGNYGINSKDMESEKIHVAALLVKECCKVPSNWMSEKSLPDFLAEQGVAGIEGLDTRALSSHLRNHGTLRGIVTTDTKADIAELVAKAKALPLVPGGSAAKGVAAAEPWILTEKGVQKISLATDGSYTWKGKGTPLLVYDFGINWSLVRTLEEQGFECLMVPPLFSLEAAKASGASAVLLSTGPGNPEAPCFAAELALIKELTQNFPTAGIGLGHQLLGKTLGGRICALPTGRHGGNQAVKHLETGRIDIPAQNANYYIDIEGLADLSPTFMHVNENTLEGFKHATLPLMAVQHYPLAKPIYGPSFYSSMHEMINAARA